MIEVISYCCYRSSDLPDIKYHADRIHEILQSDDLTQSHRTLKDAYPYRDKIPSFRLLVRRMYRHIRDTYNSVGTDETFEAYYDSMLLYLQVWSLLETSQRYL